MKPLSISCAALIAACIGLAQGPATSPQPPAQGAAPRRQFGDPTQSPAAKPRPKAASLQTYSAEQVKEGGARFAAQCGFCHGRDATGGESGPDLTRSTLVAEDVRGDKLIPFLHVGRPNAGMPAYDLPTEEANSLVAFVHSQMDKFATLSGGRRSVEPEDLMTGNAEAGRAYFNGAGQCSSCHSPTGDLAGVGSKYKGLALLRKILSPGGGRDRKRSTATITLASGEEIKGAVAAEDEFSVTILNAANEKKKYQRDAGKVKIEDPYAAHFNLLGKYTDADMHNLYAYLETLK